MKSFEAALERLSTKNILIRFYKYYIIDSILIVKREGFKTLIKKRGWKIFAVVIAYYAVRDSILYLLIPFLIAKNII
jgi:hypothetical protein